MSKLGPFQEEQDGTEVGTHGRAVARFLGMTLPSMTRMARLEEMRELDVWDK